jgi:hypothetical protein
LTYYHTVTTFGPCADLHCHSDADNWLVVVGDTALYSGNGDTFNFYIWHGEDIVDVVCNAPLGKGSIKIHS